MFFLICTYRWIYAQKYLPVWPNVSRDVAVSPYYAELGATRNHRPVTTPRHPLRFMLTLDDTVPPPNTTRGEGALPPVSLEVVLCYPIHADVRNSDNASHRIPQAQSRGRRARSPQLWLEKTGLCTRQTPPHPLRYMSHTDES